MSSWNLTKLCWKSAEPGAPTKKKSSRHKDQDMSTTEKEDGCVVITGVDPQGEPSKMGAGAIRSPMKPLQSFYKGEPVALGVTLIICGIIQIFLGIVHDVGDTLRHPLFFTGAPEWSGILCIISGSLSVAAAKKPRIGLLVSSGIMFILLAFSVLQFCVSVSVSAFGCKTLCRTAYSEVNVVIYQTAPPNSADPGVSTVL
ncbi:membrane-spanning 4-domains subfamily A member 4D-like isoform X3 [Lissotriton helveticus]